MYYILHVAASDEADITDNLVVYTIKREDSTVKLKSYIKQIKEKYPKTEHRNHKRLNNRVKIHIN